MFISYVVEVVDYVQRFPNCCHLWVQGQLNEALMSCLSASNGLSAGMIYGMPHHKTHHGFCRTHSLKSLQKRQQPRAEKAPSPHGNGATRLPSVGMSRSLLGAPPLTLGSCQASSARGSLPLCPSLSTFLLLSAHCARFPMKLSFQSLKWPPLNLLLGSCAHTSLQAFPF